MLTQSYSNGVNGTKKCIPEESPVFRNLDGCNVGFKNWHPVPVTPNGDKLAGQGEMGGVWEWTSTPLMPHEGFRAMEIYPGYTCEKYSLAYLQITGLSANISIADFFDGKHHIIQGGSWATLPRIAGRTTL